MSAAALPARPPASPNSSESASPPVDTSRAEESLDQLFARVQDGDAGAFAEFHIRTRRRLHQVVAPVVGSSDLADDVVQDAYLHIWMHRHQFRPKLGSVTGWMTTIARRRAVDRVRTLTRARTQQVRYTTDPSRSAETDHQSAVTDAVHAATLVGPALNVLTELQREALLLTYGDDRTAAQAARLLGIPVPTLKSRIHSATTRLRQLLTPPSTPTHWSW